jgi:hypothetical protein
MLSARLLRYADIVLIAMLAGIIGYIAICAIKKNLAPKKWTTDLILTILLLAGGVGSMFATMDAIFFAEPATSTVEIHVTGVISAAEGEAAFGPYWDVTATSPVISVDWGVLDVGEAGEVQFWIKNEGTTDLWCVLNWDIASWEPLGAEQYFDLSWNYGGTSVSPGRARRVTLSLFVHDDIVDVEAFSFQMIITGSDEPIGGEPV